MADFVFEGEELVKSIILQQRMPRHAGVEERTLSTSVISSNEFSLPWFFRPFFIKKKGTREITKLLFISEKLQRNSEADMNQKISKGIMVIYLSATQKNLQNSEKVCSESNAWYQALCEA